MVWNNLIGNSWDFLLESEYNKEYFISLFNFIKEEYSNKIVHPKYEDIFNALKLTDYENVKVVIIGQDPYHGFNQAQGLSFSVPENEKRPPSLRNIFKELKNDLNIDKDCNDLKSWADQGVLLLNTILTVVDASPLSHENKGWEIFTDKVIEKLNERDKPIVFILWGNNARSKKRLITNEKHFIIESAHPSPLSASRGFFGSRPFSKTNQILIENNMKEIRW